MLDAAKSSVGLWGRSSATDSSPYELTISPKELWRFLGMSALGLMVYL